MLLRNSNLYLILDTEAGDYQRLLTIACEAMKGGVDMIQLRDKKGSAKGIIDFSKRIRKLVGRRIPYIINDRLDVAMAGSADGIHLGQDDLPVKTARRLLGRRFIIGASCQSLAHALEAQRQGASYIGFGSVFKTPTKPERQPMDLNLLSHVIKSKKIKIPIFAIGGISLDKIPLLRQAGVSRVAVCRAICHADNIEEAAALLKKSLGS